MLQISDDFLTEEVRDGFYIESMMKRAWAVQLNVLSEIDRICKKYNLTYFAASGTILGAVRHKGYIPWDDDIDLAMKRADYMQFIKVAPEELPFNYHLHSYFTYSDHNNFLSAVMNENDYQFDFPYIAGVDIMPLDYVPKNEDDYFFFRTLFGLIYETARTSETLSKKELEDKLIQINDLTGIHIEQDNNTHQNLWLLADKIAQMYDKSEAKAITYIPYLVCDSEDWLVDIDCYSSNIEMPFEMTSVPIPTGYNEILNALYGNDYMTPKNVRGGHDYPFYATQQKRY